MQLIPCPFPRCEVDVWEEEVSNSEQTNKITIFFGIGIG